MAHLPLSQDFLIFVSKPAISLQSTSPLSHVLSPLRHHSTCLHYAIILALGERIEGEAAATGTDLEKRAPGILREVLQAAKLGGLGSREVFAPSAPLLIDRTMGRMPKLPTVQ